MKSIAVIMACYNRKKLTINAIESVLLQVSSEDKNVCIDVYLFDDASSDGTVEAVNERFSNVVVIRGEGNYFWARGMSTAWSEAAKKNKHTHFFLFNDDVVLSEKALVNMLSVSEDLNNSAVCVGATNSRITGKMTYSGILQGTQIGQCSVFSKVEPDSTSIIDVDTFNGNIVLIPKSVFDIVGVLDSNYEHGMADFDYGLRCKKMGIRVVLLPKYLGTCENNFVADTFMDEKVPVMMRWKKMLSPKGLPYKSWLVFSKRHFGTFWIVYFLWPYVKFWLNSVFFFLRLRKS